MRLFWLLMKTTLVSYMQHRLSFFLQTLAQFMASCIEIFGLWVLFCRFSLIEGWSMPELAVMLGITHIGFAIADAFSRGFDTFSQLVKRGDFDRLLLRPISPFVQVATREVHLIKIGRLVQGLLVLVYGISSLHLHLFPDGLIILLAICGTASLFTGLFIVQAALAFWTTENLSLMDITTYGGRETGQYPISIYDGTLQFVFTFLIPLACVSFYPASVVLHHGQSPLWAGFLSPLAGGLFLYLSYRLWQIGVRHYQSTGS